MKLVIVESPTKAKTLQKFLGKEYKITSSYGHVRDLPKNKIGIDIEKDFNPQYSVVPKAKKTIKELKSLAEKADQVLLATDPDREGEAISWHLAHVLESKKKSFERVSFHEITKDSVENSLKNPGKVNLDLVNSQQARRILDRLVGYKLSPFLWKKVIRGLSAGRVQSVALRFVVDREREIEKFRKEEYWTIDVQFIKEKQGFSARLVKINDKTISKLGIENKKQAQEIKEKLEKENYFVSDVKNKKVKKNPLPPFVTSTLQQEAYKKLGFSSKLSMMVAQQLYEKGHITYHRTDSYNLSAQAINQSKKFITLNYGEKYWQGTRYKAKSKNIQEAHEAVRPTYPGKSPDSLQSKLDKRQKSLYRLIWQRFTASLMSPAVMDRITVEIDTQKEKFTLRSSGQAIEFDGFLKVYPIKMEEKTIPFLEIKESLNFNKAIAEQHFTQPPPRFTEATLIKILEEKGIGRPSTYASTISVIQDRNYVQKDDEKRFSPTEIGIVVNDLLVEHFPEIVDVKFTAEMEKSLDEIAEGKIKWTSVVQNFYFPFEKNLKIKEKEIDKKELTEKETDEICEKCDAKMVSKIGRFGRFIACSNYPECKNTKPTEEETRKEPCEKCGSFMVLKRSKFGSFWGCSNYPECKNIRKDEKETGIVCPKCKKGMVVIRKSKRKRNFYGCNRYPECDFISNKKPE